MILIEILDKYDLKLHIKILSFLYKRGRLGLETYSKDIEIKFGIKKSFVSSLLKDLETDKLIHRTINGKRKRILITKIGISIIKHCIYTLLAEEDIKFLRLPNILTH